MPDPNRTSQSKPSYTMADLLAAYEKDFLPLKALNTQRNERFCLRWFKEDLGTIPLQALSPLILRSWLDALAPYYKPASIRRYRIALSAVLTAGVQHYEWLTTHPLRKVRKLPTPPDRERCLTAAEQARLLTACQQSRNPYLYLAVVLALSTGARKNELLQRTWSDLDLERGLLHLRHTKNGDRRAVPIVGPALVLLRTQAQIPGRSRWVLPNRYGSKPMFLDYAWRQACLQARILDLHFHDLRHTAASFLAMSGASLREIAEILGHRSLRQTMKYTHLMEPHTRGVLQRMIQKHLTWPLGAEGASSPPEEPTR